MYCMCINVLFYVWNTYWSIFCVNYFINIIGCTIDVCIAVYYVFAKYINLLTRSGYIQNWVEISDVVKQCKMDKY